MSELSTTKLIPASKILDFWFGPNFDQTSSLERKSTWFSGDPSLDAMLRRDYLSLFDVPALQNPSLYTAPDNVLAAIILFDQFSRNCFRGSAKAFAFDKIALNFMDLAIQKKWHKALHPVKQSFLLMPLQHSESLARQQQSLEMFELLIDQGVGEIKALLSNTFEYAKEHHDLIKRFGRFPHRNKILGRVSTAAEQAYLDGGGKTFGQ